MHSWKPAIKAHYTDYARQYLKWKQRKSVLSTTAFHQLHPMTYLPSQTKYKNTKWRLIAEKEMQNDGSPDNQKIPLTNIGIQSPQFDVIGEEQNLKAAESITGRLKVWFFIFVYIFKYCKYNATSTCVPKCFRKIPLHRPIIICSNGEKVLLTHCWCHQSSGFSQECLHHSCSHQHQLQRTCPGQQFPCHSCQSGRYSQGETQLPCAVGLCTWSEQGLCEWNGCHCCGDNQHPRMEHPLPAAEDWPAPASRSQGLIGWTSLVCFSHSPQLSQCCQKLSPMCCQTEWRSQWTVLSLFLKNREKWRLEEKYICF